MGKYKEMLGIGKVTIDGNEFQVSPDMLDCEAFSVIRKTLDSKDEVLAIKKNCDLLHVLIGRNESLDDEDSKELKNFLYLNQKECLEESHILFKWTTREEREEQKELLKNALKNPSLIKDLMK